jgi:hypothetical protein
MRDRLIELIRNAPRTNVVYGDIKLDKPVQTLQTIADHLLANGVIVPPCKVGQTVWFIRNQKIIETKVDKIVLKYCGLYIKLDCNSMYETSCNSIGKTVFLTREEAEAKLKELRNNDL